jgi:hypothetical protein
LDHWGESQNRHRGDKRYPEPLTVIGDHRTVIMTAMSRMAFVGISFSRRVMRVIGMMGSGLIHDLFSGRFHFRVLVFFDFGADAKTCGSKRKRR